VNDIIVKYPKSPRRFWEIEAWQLIIAFTRG